MSEDEKETVKHRLTALRQEHRDLDSAISSLEERVYADPLQIHRMKKRKLRLKDMITKLEDELTADIVA